MGPAAGTDAAAHRRGVLQALAAYGIWGLFPLLFRAVGALPAGELLAHRVVWSAAFVLGLLAWQRRWAWIGPALADRRVALGTLASASLIGLNWLIYLWAVATERVVEASLGYFINPLVNVLLAAWLLQERLRPGQWLAVGCAAAGVLGLALQAGGLPWIALGLALSFAGYALLRKTARLGAVEGLALETLMLAPLAVLALAGLGAAGLDRFAGLPVTTQALVLATGPITVVPLILFAAGARRIPFSLLGLLQYIVPSTQLAIGVLVFGEAFGPAQALGFGAIWLGLLVYRLEDRWAARRGPRA